MIATSNANVSSTDKWMTRQDYYIFSNNFQKAHLNNYRIKIIELNLLRKLF